MKTFRLGYRYWRPVVRQTNGWLFNYEWNVVVGREYHTIENSEHLAVRPPSRKAGTRERAERKAEDYARRLYQKAFMKDQETKGWEYSG